MTAHDRGRRDAGVARAGSSRSRPGAAWSGCARSSSSTAICRRRARWFTTCFFHHPAGLAAEVTAGGFELGAVLAIEGPAGIPGEIGYLNPWLDDPSRHETLLRAIRRVEAEPSLLGASPHLMAIATRP